MNARFFPFASLALVLAASTGTSVASAQRCVNPADSADNPAQNRWCGAPLITGLGGLAGFGSNDSCLKRNDDGSSARIDITPYFPGGLRFFTPTPHTHLYVNTNGNISFGGPVSTYTPQSFPIADNPMIAPFWADVDIRRASGSCVGSAGRTCNPCDGCEPYASGQVWWHFEEGRAIFTWHEVGYYECRVDRRQSFQLILEAVDVCGTNNGDFNVEFRFNRCEWDTGDASGGSGGFATFLGTAAQSGFDAGDRTNFVELMGSRETRTINRRLCEESNVGEPGVWRFQLRAGAVQCPDAGMECATGMQGVCAEGRTSCACEGAACTTSCEPQVTPRAERCNQLDDDCDGTVDEDDGTLCPAGQTCTDGACVGSCFEGGCPDGFSCTEAGCVESACVDVTCPPGERCRDGACVDACGGVTCPEPTVCVGGACVDLCATIGCDECTACTGGACVLRCDLGGSCGAGQECDTATGVCVDAGCAGRPCGEGFVCRAGSCVDACVGAVCPEGEMCTGGACVPEVVAMPDAGVPEDAGTIEVDAGSSDFDAGTVEDPDAGRRRRPPTTGDGCCTVAAGAERGRQGGGLVAALAIGVAVLVRLRRRR